MRKDLRDRIPSVLTICSFQHLQKTRGSTHILDALASNTHSDSVGSLGLRLVGNQLPGRDMHRR